MIVGKLQGLAEKAINDCGIPATHFRPTFFHSNIAGHAHSIKEKSTLFSAWGDKKFSGIEVADIAAAMLAVAKNPSKHAGKVYTLTVRETRSGAEVAAALSKALGREIKYVAVTDEQLRAHLKSAGLPQWHIDRFSELNTIVSQGWGANTATDLKDLTGRDGISFEQWAMENASAFA